MIAAIAFMTLFLGGGALGVALADALAPNSWLAQVVGLFALPGAFAASLQLWYGVALLSLISRTCARLRHSNSMTPNTDTAQPSLPGPFVFVPITSGVGALAGIVVGLLSATRSTWLVAGIYWMVGTAHGLVAWRLARSGYLSPPESV